MILLLLAACGGDVDSVAADPCADRARPSWTGFADGFFRTYCRSCHSATAPDRHDAPEGLDFDTEEQAVALAASVRSSVLERETMPIGLGVLDVDRELLTDWLDCTVGP